MFKIVAWLKEGTLNNVGVTLNKHIDLNSALFLADRYINNGSTLKVIVYDESLPEGSNEVFKLLASQEVN